MYHTTHICDIYHCIDVKYFKNISTISDICPAKNGTIISIPASIMPISHKYDNNIASHLFIHFFIIHSIYDSIATDNIYQSIMRYIVSITPYATNHK